MKDSADDNEMTKIDNDYIISKIKERIDIDYYDKVIQENREIKPEWMLEPQKPESLVEQVFNDILLELDIPSNSIISQNRIKLYDLFKDKKYKYPDYKLIRHRRSDKNLLIELEPYNSNIEIGIKQAKEWIKEISIGTYNNALVINLNKFILIYFDGKQIRQKEVSIEDACKYMTDIVLGKRTTVNLEEISKITEQFYNQFYAIVHGGSYINTEGERITISIEDCMINNLLYDDQLNEIEKIEFGHTIFNRLIFIKILIDWNLFPKIFSYFRQLPRHLIHTELNNLFFKTLAIEKEERVNLPEEFEAIPFLNGGLFRVSSIEEINPDLMIDPPYLMKILDFLEEYSFLDNGDRNSSINSEILGYIFEKTIEFRKGTGSYYTHNLICDFMCEHVLFPHLLARINNYLEAIGYRKEELLENFEEIFMLKETTLFNIYEKIVKNVKICDICVGSGAFLLAMGNLLLEIHKRILQILHQDFDETNLKQFIVEYNLFGVDLMTSAIQICQLRLWLWISENSTELKPLPNIEYNLRIGNTLLGSDSRIDIRTVDYEFIKRIQGTPFITPNMPDYKKIIKELETGVISFDNLKKLKSFLLNTYLYSHDKNTALLKDLIESLNELIIQNADRIYLDSIKNIIKNARLKKKVNLEFLRRKKAFYWHLEFPQIFPRGFDIIVGNPPYVSAKFMEKIPLEQDIQDLSKELKKRTKKLKKLKSQYHIEKYRRKIQELKQEISSKKQLLTTDYYQEEKLFNTIYKEFLRKNYNWTYKIYDILVPFFERGFNLLKDNGRTYLSFITSNKFLATDYGEKIRKDLLNDYKIGLLVDISMIKVFKDAAVYPIIISIKKSPADGVSMIKTGRYRDINELGNKLYLIEQERYNNIDIKYLIYVPLFNDSFQLFDKLCSHSNCVRVGEEFISYYREFDFTNWEDYEVFVKAEPGANLGEDYYFYVTNNDISPFKINVQAHQYFHRVIPEDDNPRNLRITEGKWQIFKEELLLIKEVALDVICALGENYANVGKIYALKLKSDSRLSHLNNYYFLALFNSKLLDFYFRVIFWNTHLSGGYLNYHFSYLKTLLVLNINSESVNYKRIVLLSRCLVEEFNELGKQLLDFLIINAYFSDDFLIPLNITNILDEFIDENAIDRIVQELFTKLKTVERDIQLLQDHRITNIIKNEREFKS